MERMIAGAHKLAASLRKFTDVILYPKKHRRQETAGAMCVSLVTPPELVSECMNALELFLHEERKDLTILIRAGLIHVQFESIHPFLDGNGRLGRLLITFLLCAAGVLREPILYLSLYFKQHRSAYYDLLDRVRTKGDWETWLDFFLTGVRDTSEQAATAARRILALFQEHQRQIEALGRPAASVLRVFEHLRRSPIVSIPGAAGKIPTVAEKRTARTNLFYPSDSVDCGTEAGARAPQWKATWRANTRGRAPVTRG